MKGMFGRSVLLLAVAVFMGTGTTQMRAQATSIQPGAAKPAEQVYKNIQVLKGTPADQIPTAMQFISASLGVECNYCHTPQKFDDDSAKPKGVARNMIRMVMAINKENFDGKREVTCYSCHHGSADPIGTPLVGEDPAAETHGADVHKTTEVEV